MLTALKHALNVLRHNFPYAFNLALRSPQCISLPSLCSALLDHQLLQRSIEARAPIGRQVCEVGFACIEGFEELLLEVCEEAEGYALSEVSLGDYKERQSAC
jgi:hypothetical protein